MKGRFTSAVVVTLFYGDRHKLLSSCFRLESQNVKVQLNPVIAPFWETKFRLIFFL